MENRKEEIEEILKEMNISFSRRISIKCFRDGSTDKNRLTYCLSIVSDSTIIELMSHYTKNEEAIRYMTRRNNDSTIFIVSIDLETTKFYLDSGFILDRISMISVEIKPDDTFRIRDYTPKKGEIFPLKDFEPYVSKLILLRSDGQKYVKFLSVPDIELFLDYCEDEEFIRSVKGSPTWLQYSRDSITFYFCDD